MDEMASWVKKEEQLQYSDDPSTGRPPETGPSLPAGAGKEDDLRASVLQAVAGGDPQAVATLATSDTGVPLEGRDAWARLGA